MPTELTDTFKMSISKPLHTVIIPTAGTGSRMGNYTKNLNKTLLPYKNKPVLSHIIDSFPQDTHFVIPVGYLSQQVKDFCSIAYGDKHITFVDIDDWTSPVSGTAYTLKKCREVVHGPFWYVTCDTYMSDDVVSQLEAVSGNTDCYWTKTVPVGDTHLYTMFETTGSTITDIVFKQTVDNDRWLAFTGVMYIRNHEQWWNTLETLDSVEFIDNIKPGATTLPLDTWLDFGSPEIYKRELGVSQRFDFSKQDEVTYICKDRVIKWWLDHSTAQKKYQRVTHNPDIYPLNVGYRGNYLGYDLHPGSTLYEFNNPAAFDELLDWLDSRVWLRVDENISEQCMEFYKAKSLGRIQKYLERYPSVDTVKWVDGVAVKHYTEYLSNIDWHYLANTSVAAYTHGDLQFDNIIIQSNGDFKLIDWRHEFAGLTHCGDLYYDLAKMLGGCITSYLLIKEHRFDIEHDDDNVTLSIPSVDHSEVYIKKLESWVKSHGLDWRKVQMLVPLIYWNMAPLHTPPFDKFLWYLGLKLWELLDK